MKLLGLFILLISCGADKHYDYNQGTVVIDNFNQFDSSTTAGNLVATAIKEENDLDIVLYPTVLLRDNIAIYDEKMTTQQTEDLVAVYPDGEKDQFVVGTMRGSDLKTLIRQRSIERFAVELEVAGMEYELLYQGGILRSEAFIEESQNNIQDQKNYSVAISKHFIFSSETFPSYKYRNSIDRIFIDSKTVVSARASLRSFLKSGKAVPLLTNKRAQVKLTKIFQGGQRAIYDIQGNSHISPFLNYEVTTEGIVTGVALVDYYPGGQVIYIQDPQGDNNPKTSDAIKVFLEEPIEVKIGDLIQVTGIVFEETNHIENGLTSTAIRNVTKTKINAINQKLPEAILIGENIPEEFFSTYHGDLNFKKDLNLKDGLDFWESLEGMRITLSNPKIVGFRGGKEQSDDEKSHLTLFLLPNGNKRRTLDSRGNGIMADPTEEKFNPQIIPLASGPLTKGLNIGGKYEMGDIIEGKLTGLLTFAKNLFGDAEFVLNLPEQQDAIKNLNQRISSNRLESIADRPSVKYNNEFLSIASYNVKNLSPANKPRIKETAKMIKTNLNCPDVVGLVEIQDNNGEDFEGNSEASDTLSLLIESIPCSFKYAEANIDPLLHREGGVPGGNIRVSLIYNTEKLGFKENPLPGPERDTVIMSNGSMSFNPARIYPRDPAFRNTRKSLVVEFDYKGRKLFVVVNHLNSKLSDTSHFSSVWPMIYPSERKRSLMAQAVNRFVARVERRNPDALIAVVGDFNEFIDMPAMQVLKGNTLYNLMKEVPKNERYTTNHNGNAQPLDYIFVNKNLKEIPHFFKPLHLNSDYMGRLSDHDPIISVFEI